MMLSERNVLPNGRMTEVSGESLVGADRAGTAAAMERTLESALGGVLFVRELAPLAQAAGKGAADALAGALEKYGDELIVILCGSSFEATGFVTSRGALESFFAPVVHLPEQQERELLEQFRRLARDEGGYTVAAAAETQLAALLSERTAGALPPQERLDAVRDTYEKIVQDPRFGSSYRITPEHVAFLSEGAVEAGLG